MRDPRRRPMADLAGDAPAGIDAAAVLRKAARRRSGLAAVAALTVVAIGVVVAVALPPGVDTETLKPAPFATAASPRPTGPAAQSVSPDASPSASPSTRGTASAAPQASQSANGPPPASGQPENPKGLPAVVIAAEGSRIGQYRTADGARTGWLTPDRPGYGAGNLALTGSSVLYGLGNANANSRGVWLAPRPARADSGPAQISDPGGFWPTALPDGSRYAFLASGDDAAYTPQDGTLRLVVHEADGNVQAAAVDPAWLLAGLAFAAPDLLVLSANRESGGPGAGLQVYDLQTDQARLGTRAPDERFVAPPNGCDWTLPTATPDPSRVLVLERCSAPDGGDWTAVTVNVSTGRRVSVFGAVRSGGPGQVDSLDLDATGRHLLAQIHSGSDPAPDGTGAASADGLSTTRLSGGRTITVTDRLVTPVWD